MRNSAVTPGAIEPATLYRLDTLKQASGVGSWGIRQMRRAGLPVKYVGGRGFVLGRDFIEHVVNVGDSQHQNARGPR
jgi:hypothetical protein